MKKEKKTKTSVTPVGNNSDVDEKKPRTVKISADMHKQIRVLAVTRDMPMQSFIERMLQFGLDKKAYEKFPAIA
jgi:hypothetical protein